MAADGTQTAGAKGVTFVHSADWQIGKRLAFLPTEAGAVLRDARLSVVGTILELARTRGAAFVTVAGDTFEHHALEPRTLLQTLDVLREAPCPVYLLPGNHDPATPDALWRTAAWRAHAPEHVHVLTTPEPVEAAPGVWLLPCPLVARRALDDPTKHLTPDHGPPPGQAHRIGLAHGPVLEALRALADEGQPDALLGAVSQHLARDAGLDFLGLGDWHSLMRVGPRTWYPGTPEATRFKEREPGHALVVRLSAPGAEPEVEAVHVARSRWIQHTAELEAAEDVDALAAWLEALPHKRETLVELTLSGRLDPATLGRLEGEVLSGVAPRLRHLRVRDDALEAWLDEGSLDDIATEGWIRDAVEALEVRRRTAEADPDAAAAAGEALRLLHRLAHEARG